MTTEILTCAKCRATAPKGEPPFENGNAKAENIVTINFCDECYARGLTAAEIDALLQEALYAESLEKREEKRLTRRRVQEGTLIDQEPVRGATGPTGPSGDWSWPARPIRPTGPQGPVGVTGPRGVVGPPNPNRIVQEGTPVDLSSIASPWRATGVFGFTSIPIMPSMASFSVSPDGPFVPFIPPTGTGTFDPPRGMCSLCRSFFAPEDLTGETVIADGRPFHNVCVYCHATHG